MCINDIRVCGLACLVLFNKHGPRVESRDEMEREFCSCSRAQLETCDGQCGSVVLRAWLSFDEFDSESFGFIFQRRNRLTLDARVP